jgi:hypothetical protein
MAVQYLKEFMSIYKGTSMKLLKKKSDFSAVEFRSHFFTHGVLDTTLCDNVYQRLVAVQFSLSISVSSTNKTDHHDITKIFHSQKPLNHH